MTLMDINTLGFIGLGVMGEPICRNLAQKSGLPVHAFDRDPLPMQRLEAVGVEPADSVADVVAKADMVFLSLPSGEVLHGLATEPEGLIAGARKGQLFVDLGTSPLDTTLELGRAFSSKGADFMDAPVARTRAAAEAGTLSVMVGANEALFNLARPYISTFASDVTHCGQTGSGQVVKILNNMVLFETVVALSEAKAIGERLGVEPSSLFEAFTKGSADSFALRSHGMKSMLPQEFPERAFSVKYARKDLGYALRLAHHAGIDAQGARGVDRLYQGLIDAGLGDFYHPIVSRLIAESGN